jgi:hypothetical protein
MFFEHKLQTHTTEILRWVTALQQGWQDWVRREIIDFDPYDDEYLSPELQQLLQSHNSYLERLRAIEQESRRKLDLPLVRHGRD